MIKYFDSHCHLQNDVLIQNIDYVIDRAKSVNIQKVVCLGTCENDWNDVLSLHQKNPEFIIPAFGMHPWYLKNRSVEWLTKLENLISSTSCCCVGEIGLDHAITDFNIEEQNEIFVSQLKLAIKYKKPINIHCRKAFETLSQIFDKTPPSYGCVIHSYSGASEFVPVLNKYGVHFSFSGSITRSKNKKGQKALMQVPLDKLLIETDSPDLPPVGFEDKPNEPANIVHVLETVSRIRNINLEELADNVLKNSISLFCR